MKPLKAIALLLMLMLGAVTEIWAQRGLHIYQPENPAEPLFTIADSVVLFSPGDAGSKFYRIPAICTTNTGTLIVAADKRWHHNGDLPADIDVVTRRSTDGGKTWEPAITVAGADTEVGYGDPAIVFDFVRNTAICIFTHGNGLFQSTPDNNAHIIISKSTDDGKSWSAPIDINDQLFAGHPEWVTSFAGSGHACQMRNGRLLFVIQVRPDTSSYGPLSCYACYSDDGGDTWHASKVPGDYNGDESKIVELSDGRLMMSIRRRYEGYHRRFSFSDDGGETWSETITSTQMLDPACNGDVINYSYGKNKDILIHTIPYHSRLRKNVSLLVSFDDGKTWPWHQAVVPTGSAYSSITQLADGTLGCVVERNSPLNNGGFDLVYYHLIPSNVICNKK